MLTVLLNACENHTHEEFEQEPIPLQDSILSSFPSEIVCVPGIESVIYLNECVRGEDSGIDNTLKNDYTCKISRIGSESINDFITNTPEGIYIKSQEKNIGNHPLCIEIYNKTNELLSRKEFVVKVINPQQSHIKKTILLLGDSWTAINSITGEGYVHFIHECFQKTGIISPTFIGTRATNNGIKHEGRGGYMALTWASKPTNDIVNPLWNPETDELDFTRYRQELCGNNTPIDLVNIQLGVNESLRKNENSDDDINTHVNAFIKLIEAIQKDSPSCKIIVQQCGLDEANYDAFSNFEGGKFNKESYQANIYKLRVALYNELSKRSDFNNTVFWGQAVLGLNRWSNYDNAVHPNTDGYKEMGYMAVPQMIDILLR